MANRQKPRGKIPIIVLAAILLGLAGASVSRDTPFVGRILGNERPLAALVMERLRGLAVAPTATPRVVVFLPPPVPAPPKEPEAQTTAAPPASKPPAAAPPAETAPADRALDKVVARIAADLKSPPAAPLRPVVEDPPWPAAEPSPRKTRPAPMTESQVVARIAADLQKQAPLVETAMEKPVLPPTVPEDALRQEAALLEAPPNMVADQPVEIARRSNLRARPDTASEIIAKLEPGTRVKVLEPRTLQGYYQVLHTTGTGWLWWRNVTPLTVGAAAKLAAAPEMTAKTKRAQPESLAPVAAAESVSDLEGRTEPDPQLEAARKLIGRIRSTSPSASSPEPVAPSPAEKEKPEGPPSGETQAPDLAPAPAASPVRAPAAQPTPDQVAAVPVPSAARPQVFVEPITGVSPRPGDQTTGPRDQSSPETEQAQRLLGMVEGGTQEARFHAAAQKGRVAAQYNLGVLYYLGQGVPQDHARAAKWFRRAAEQGDPDSQYNLGILYYQGLGVPRDLTQAFMWIDRAAEQGQSEAIKARRSITAELPAGTVNESATRNAP